MAAAFYRSHFASKHRSGCPEIALWVPRRGGCASHPVEGRPEVRFAPLRQPLVARRPAINLGVQTAAAVEELWTAWWRTWIPRRSHTPGHGLGANQNRWDVSRPVVAGPAGVPCWRAPVRSASREGWSVSFMVVFSTPEAVADRDPIRDHAGTKVARPWWLRGEQSLPAAPMVRLLAGEEGSRRRRRERADTPAARRWPEERRLPLARHGRVAPLCRERAQRSPPLLAGGR
jgi:hypothetical protein